jgi:hypothetical protein
MEFYDVLDFVFLWCLDAFWKRKFFANLNNYTGIHESIYSSKYSQVKSSRLRPNTLMEFLISNKQNFSELFHYKIVWYPLPSIHMRFADTHFDNVKRSKSFSVNKRTLSKPIFKNNCKITYIHPL